MDGSNNISSGAGCLLAMKVRIMITRLHLCLIVYIDIEHALLACIAWDSCLEA